MDKIKRPGGIFGFDATLSREDEWGSWLFAPAGTPLHSPKGSGAFQSDVLLLIDSTNLWVAWWVDDPGDRLIAIDICLPPQRTDGGWMYVDLELDPVRHESGLIEVEDEDEFLDACQAGAIDSVDAAVARTTATAAVAALTDRIEPYGTVGWDNFRAHLAERPDIGIRP